MSKEGWWWWWRESHINFMILSVAIKQKKIIQISAFNCLFLNVTNFILADTRGTYISLIDPEKV